MTTSLFDLNSPLSPLNTLDPYDFGAVLRRACALLALAAPVSASGDVWRVDDDGGADVDAMDLQEASDLAANGDTLLVMPGTYGALEVNGKALTVLGQGAVLLDGAQLWIHDLPLGETVIVRGLSVVGPTAGPTSAQVPLRLANNAGHVWLEDCEFRHVNAVSPGVPALTAAPGGSIANSAAVTLVRCVLLGRRQVYSGSLFSWTVAGLLAQQSSVAIHDSQLEGSDGAGGAACFGACPGLQGGPGLAVYDSYAFVSGSTLRGGQGLPGADGSSLLNCGQGGKGGHALQLSGGVATSAVLVETGLAPGAAGEGGTHPSGFSCNDGVNGIAVVNLSSGNWKTMPGLARRATIATTTDELELASLDVTGQPGDFVFAFISGGPNQNPLYTLGGMIGIAPPQFLVTLAAVDETGAVSLPIAAPPLSVPQSLTFHLQLAHLTPNVSVVLGNPTVWTVLDVPK